MTDTNPLTLRDYQDKAMSLRLESATPLYVLTGLVGEVGEFFNHVSKSIRDGQPPNLDLLLKKELGDILWFVTAVAQDLGFSLEDVAQTNLDKLFKRKDDGTLQGSGDER